MVEGNYEINKAALNFLSWCIVVIKAKHKAVMKVMMDFISQCSAILVCSEHKFVKFFTLP